MSDTRSFRGLNNVTDPLRLGLSWLARADNVDITDTGAIEKREGYAPSFTGDIQNGNAYATLDYSKLFVVDGGTLKVMTDPAAAVSLQAGVGDDPMHFAEVNDQVFFNNGVSDGIVKPDNTVMPWRWSAPAAPSVAAVTGNLPAGLYQVRCTFFLPDGRETGASESAEIVLGEGQAVQVSGIPAGAQVYIAPADSEVYQFAGAPVGAMVWNDSPDLLGRDLLTIGMDPLPLGADIIQEWGGRVYAVQRFQPDNQTAIWFSQPLGFHLFKLSSDFLAIPGMVTMLAPAGQALIIGTETEIYAYSADGLSKLANYGVVPGKHWSQDGGRTLFWSKRGLCAALPFTNLTERQVSVPPGLQAGGTLVERDGRKRYLVALHQGDSAFNPHP